MAWTWVFFHFSRAEASVQSDLVLTVRHRLGLCTLVSQTFCHSEFLLSTCHKKESPEKRQGLSTEEFPRSRWPAIISVGNCLDC